MTYILASIIVVLAVLAMAVGVLFGRARIRGSCGALAGMRDEEGNVLCDACSNPSPDFTGGPDQRRCKDDEDDQSDDAECVAGRHHAEHGS